MSDNSNRREVERWAQQYLSGALAFHRFLELVPEDTEDEAIAELLDLIVHEPKDGGICGADSEEYARHMDRIRALVDVLADRSGSEGTG